MADVKVTYGGMEFAKNLSKLIAHDPGLSQNELARRLGVSQNLVSLWRRGRSVPDLAAAQRIAEFFSVPIVYLADDGMDEKPREYTADERALIGVYRGSGLTLEEATQRMSGRNSSG